MRKCESALAAPVERPSGYLLGHAPLKGAVGVVQSAAADAEESNSQGHSSLRPDVITIPRPTVVNFGRQTPFATMSPLKSA